MQHVRRWPLAWCIGILAVGMVLSAIASAMSAPSLTFLVSLETRYAQFQIDSRVAALREINLNTLAVEGRRKDKQNEAHTGQVNVGPITTAEIDRELIEAAQGDTIALDVLTLPDGATLRLKALPGREALEIDVEALNVSHGAVDLYALWDAQAGIEPPQSGRLTEAVQMRSWNYRAPGMTVRLFHPDEDTNMIRPFRFSEVVFDRTIRGETDLEADYQESLVLSGDIQFFSFDNALPAYRLAAGQHLRLEGVRAELSYLAYADDRISMRLFGTAEDVRSGYGTSMATIIPSAFDGLGASAWVRVTLALLMGLFLTLFGVAASLPPLRDDANIPNTLGDTEGKGPSKEKRDAK